MVSSRGLGDVYKRQIIDRKRTQWESVFSPEEMANVDRNLADVQSELWKNRAVNATGNSLTNPRGNAQDVIKGEKGVANFITGSAPALIGGSAGATAGWNSGESFPGKVGNALLYGTLGAITGKATASGAARASSTFDNLLNEALKDPRAALDALEAAKPSEFGSKLSQAISDAAKASTVRAVGKGSKEVLRNDVFKSPDPEQETKSLSLIHI